MGAGGAGRKTRKTRNSGSRGDAGCSWRSSSTSRAPPPLGSPSFSSSSPPLPPPAFLSPLKRFNPTSLCAYVYECIDTFMCWKWHFLLCMLEGQCCYCEIRLFLVYLVWVGIFFSFDFLFMLVDCSWVF